MGLHFFCPFIYSDGLPHTNIGLAVFRSDKRRGKIMLGRARLRLRKTQYTRRDCAKKEQMDAHVLD